MMKRILDEACSYPWQFIDANSVYDQVLNWYISTCDPLFILQPYLERQETPCSSNDPLVFRYSFLYTLMDHFIFYLLTHMVFCGQFVTGGQ